MEITTGEIIAHHKKELFEKINEKVYDVFFNEYLASVRDFPPVLHLHHDGSITFISEIFIEFDLRRWPCGLLDRSTGTFYNVARMFCTDPSKYPELDKAFSEFYNREKFDDRHDVYIYGLDMP